MPDLLGESDLSWEDWDIHGYTGIELWNAMSEFKSLLTGKLQAIYYAFNPEAIGTGPFPEVLEKWDQLTVSGQRVRSHSGVSDRRTSP